MGTFNKPAKEKEDLYVFFKYNKSYFIDVFIVNSNGRLYFQCLYISEYFYNRISVRDKLQKFLWIIKHLTNQTKDYI